jgi:predicted dehydrogenase
MIIYDDIEPSEKVKVYDRGISVSDMTTEGVYKMLVSYRTGDMWAPRLDLTEALQLEVAHFVRCVEDAERRITGGEAGLRVVRILEAATESMRQQGRPIALA